MSLQHLAVTVIVLSVSFQFAAGVLALRLVHISGRKLAWSFIAAALFGMGVRRFIALLKIFALPGFTTLDLEYEVVGLFVSLFLFAGLSKIRPIFLAHNEMTGKLKEGEKRLRAVVDQSLEGILALDPDTGVILDANEKLSSLMAYPREELVGRPVHQISEAPEESVKAIFQKLRQEGRLSLGERRYRRKDGETLYADVSVVLLHDVTPPVAYAFVHDLTERKEAERGREALIEELNEALAKVKLLSGFLPICASCKKIRDDKGYWTQLERYISDHAEVSFTHGICPDCKERMMEELKRIK